MKVSLDLLHPLVINIGKAVNTIKWNGNNVSNPFMCIFCVMEGEAQLTVDSITYQLRPGFLYLIPAFVVHSYVCHNPHFTYYYIHLYEEQLPHNNINQAWQLPIEILATEEDRKLVERLLHINPFLQQGHQHLNGSEPSATIQQCLQISQQRDFCTRLESRGIVYQLLSRFIKHAEPREDSTDKRIEKAVDYIHKHIQEDISLDKLSSDACMNKNHFIRLFKYAVGIPPPTVHQPDQNAKSAVSTGIRHIVGQTDSL